MWIAGWNCWTIAIPEPERFHELVEGMLVDKDAASGKHGEAQLSLGILLRPFTGSASRRRCW